MMLTVVVDGGALEGAGGRVPNASLSDFFRDLSSRACNDE
jgi:hypothetical protein